MITKIEEKKLEAFVGDEVLFSAVKKIMFSRVYEEDPTKNFALQFGLSDSDELIGQKTRARRYALELIEIGFQDLRKYKKKVETKSSINIAR